MRPHAVWTASALFAVTGPSKKLNRGPSAFWSRSLANVPLPLPELEDLVLEGVVVGLVGERGEHATDSREEAPPARR